MRLVYFTIFLWFSKILAWGEGYLSEWKPKVDYFHSSLFNFVHVFLNYQWIIQVYKPDKYRYWVGTYRKSKNTCIFDKQYIFIQENG